MTTLPPPPKPLNARRAVLLSLGATVALGLLVALSVAVFAFAKVRDPRNQPDRYAQFLALMDEGHPPAPRDDEATRFYDALLSDPEGAIRQLGAPNESGHAILHSIVRDTYILSYAEGRDPVHAGALAALTRALPALDALAPVTGIARMRPLEDRLGPPRPGMLEPLHHGGNDIFMGVSGLAQVNNLAIADAAERADWNETLTRLRVSRALAGHMGSVPSNATLGWATHIELVAGSEAVRAARLPHVDLRAVDMLLGEMERPPRFTLDPAWWMDGQTLVALDIAHERYTGRRVSFAAMLQPGFDDYASRLQRFRDATDRWASAPNASRGKAPNHRSFFRRYDPHTFPPRVVDWGIEPSFPLMLRDLWSTETQRAATLVALRVERHRLANGQLPAALADAMPPAQTLDPVSDEPFGYELAADGAAYRLRAPPGATHLYDSEHRQLSFKRTPRPDYTNLPSPDPLAVPGTHDFPEQTP